MAPLHALERRTGLDRQVFRIAAVVIAGAIMSILDTTIVNIALDDIARELHAPLDQVQWTITGYLLALSTVIRCPAGSPSASTQGAPGWRPSRCSSRARRCAASLGRPASGSPSASCRAQRRADHADRHHPLDAGRRSEPDGTRDERDGRADAARSRPRPGARGADRRGHPLGCSSGPWWCAGLDWARRRCRRPARPTPCWNRCSQVPRPRLRSTCSSA
jgi:hypothetical protein